VDIHIIGIQLRGDFELFQGVLIVMCTPMQDAQIKVRQLHFWIQPDCFLQ
jgi:hypothetical protein